MSQWTHVNGSIRVDCLRMMGDTLDFKNIFKTCDYNDDDKQWDDCNVPCGSEGSLNINIWESPEKSAMAAYTVNIFGDLRDYDDKDEIVKWFTGIVENKLGIIRDAVLTIDIAYKSYSIYGLKDDKVCQLWQRLINKTEMQV